ncbi:MAG: aminotransferase class I/II-fold pyridoxal phosphate-dependent enzyme, partial [Gammaproteobacteria bacterium]
MPATEAVSALFERKSHNPSFHAIRSATDYQGMLLDFCVPVNTYFPPAEMVELIRDNLEDVLKFYPDEAPAHEQCIADLAGIAPRHIVAGNGSTEIITSLCRDAPGPIVTTVPTFGRWTDLPPDFGVPVHFIQRLRERGFAVGIEEIVARVHATQAAAVVVCNPDNPTGAGLAAAQTRSLLRELKDLPLVVIDESFIDFSDLQSAAQLAAQSDNAIVVKSLGKSLGWHGIRLGYAVANEARAQALRKT